MQGGGIEIPCKYKLHGDDSKECDICYYLYFLDKGFSMSTKCRQ